MLCLPKQSVHHLLPPLQKFSNQQDHDHPMNFQICGHQTALTSIQLTEWLRASVTEPNMLHNYETEIITCKASDAAENLQLYQVVQFFHPRSSCMTHLMLFSEHPPIYASCMMILGGRIEQ